MSSGINNMSRTHYGDGNRIIPSQQEMHGNMSQLHPISESEQQYSMQYPQPMVKGKKHNNKNSKSNMSMVLMASNLMTKRKQGGPKHRARG